MKTRMSVALLAGLAHVLERGLSVRQTEELARRLGEAAGVGGRHPVGGEEEMAAAAPAVTSSGYSIGHASRQPT